MSESRALVALPGGRVVGRVEQSLQKANLALRVGGEYRIPKIGRRHWDRLGKDIGLSSDAVERVRDVVREVPGRMEEVCSAARAEGIDHPVVDTLEAAVGRHAATCLRTLDQPVRG